MQYIAPLINSCSSCAELYALSKQRCCNLLLSLLVGDDKDDRLITILSITSITSLMSWVLADDITTDSGIPFLPVKICLFVPIGCCQVHLIPVRSS